MIRCHKRENQKHQLDTPTEKPQSFLRVVQII